jgi:hypothetical protein
MSDTGKVYTAKKALPDLPFGFIYTLLMSDPCQTLKRLPLSDIEKVCLTKSKFSQKGFIYTLPLCQLPLPVLYLCIHT